MRTLVRLLLTAIATVAGAASLWSLFWWLFHFYQVITSNGGSEILKQFSPDLAAKADPTRLFIHQLRMYFTALGGAVGWVALFRLVQLMDRTLNKLPKWILYGCAVGVAAAIAMPYGRGFAYPPIVLAVSLLLRCYLAAPNPPLNTDAPQGGAPIS